MDFKVVLTERALRDLQEIVDYISAFDSAAAERLGTRLLNHAENLRRYPARHAFHDRARGIRKLPLTPYIIYYDCDAEAGVVTVLHFWHGARRPPVFPG